MRRLRSRAGCRQPVFSRAHCGRHGAQRSHRCQASSLDDAQLNEWEEFFNSDDFGVPEELRSMRETLNAQAVALRNKEQVNSQVKGTCYGCGMRIQLEDPQQLGYIDPELYTHKRSHKQTRQQLFCSRCHALSNGQMVPGVEDWSQKLDRQQSNDSASTSESEELAGSADKEVYMFKGDRLLSADQLRDELKGVASESAVCVMIVDVLDASGSFLTKVRNIVGRNPIIVIATKADLLPKDTDLEEVHSWLLDFLKFKKLNVHGLHLVSNKKGTNIDAAVGNVLTLRQGRSVYIMGAANVGKSAFVRCMLRTMSEMDSRYFSVHAAHASKRLPVESAMPGTTLGRVPLAAFASGGDLFDTPGLHVQHRLPHLLRPSELKRIHPRRRLRPYVAASPEQVAEQADVADEAGDVQPCGTYLWGALLRVDVYGAPADARLVFFGTGVMQVYACPLLAGDDDLVLDGPTSDEEGAEGGQAPAFGAHSVARRGGLQLVRDVRLPPVDTMQAVADVCVSGLPGWVSIVTPPSDEDVCMRLWVPKGVEVYVRPPMPCPVPVSIADVETF